MLTVGRAPEPRRSGRRLPGEIGEPTGTAADEEHVHELALLIVRERGRVAAQLLTEGAVADAAVAPPGIDAEYDVQVLTSNIGDNPNAVTRFVLVSSTRRIPERTGADKTSVIIELPTDEPGGLVEMLEQFATRGVNLSLLQSRPIGDAFGRYRFVVDLDGHIRDERVADALLGLKRFSPKVRLPPEGRRISRITTRLMTSAPASVSMCAASERSAREWARIPTTTSTAMKPAISASAAESRLASAFSLTPCVWPWA